MKLGSLGDSCMIQVSKKGIHIYFLPVPFVCRKMSGTANLTTSPLISIYNQPSKDDVGASQWSGEQADRQTQASSRWNNFSTNEAWVWWIHTQCYQQGMHANTIILCPWLQCLKPEQLLSSPLAWLLAPYIYFGSICIKLLSLAKRGYIV